MHTNTRRLGGVVAGAVVLLVVVALALGGGGVRSYPQGSPEAGMQSFLQALFDEEFDEATELLAPGEASRCADSELRWTPMSYEDSAQITAVQVDGTTADLTVVTVSRSGPFDEPYESHYEFEMEQIEGEWLIVDLDERFGCR